MSALSNEIGRQLIAMTAAAKLELKMAEATTERQRLNLLREWRGGKRMDWKMSPLELTIETEGGPDGLETKGVWYATFATSGVFVQEGDQAGSE
jgi:hypothetical protein